MPGQRLGTEFLVLQVLGAPTLILGASTVVLEAFAVVLGASTHMQGLC